MLVDANQAIYIKDVEPKAEAMPDIEQTSVQDILREMKPVSYTHLTDHDTLAYLWADSFMTCPTMSIKEKR